jgi:quinoprotein dehydrogenase-associated probable ABC transporter substrate-binding protein
MHVAARMSSSTDSGVGSFRANALVAGAILALATSGLVLVSAHGGYSRRLRVCADPNNLPFSNERGEGFENRLAEIVAKEMKAEVQYVWAAQRRGFIRNTLQAGECDVLMGIPSGYDRARATRPYYRSSYVFLYRRSSPFDVRSFDDPVLRTLRVGVHLIGDDGANAPPAHALSARGIVGNMVGYSIYGNYAEPNPPARLVDAVARGDVDVAVVWGPLAGYFAARQAVPLEMTPTPDSDGKFLPLAYDISVGVRKKDAALQERLDLILTKRAKDIDALLDSYNLPHSAPVRKGTAETAPH